MVMWGDFRFKFGVLLTLLPIHTLYVHINKCQVALDTPKGHFAPIELMNNSAVLRAPSAKVAKERRNQTLPYYGQWDNG
jgi:hypothetical protein